MVEQIKEAVSTKLKIYQLLFSYIWKMEKMSFPYRKKVLSTSISYLFEKFMQSEYPYLETMIEERFETAVKMNFKKLRDIKDEKKRDLYLFNLFSIHSADLLFFYGVRNKLIKNARFKYARQIQWSKDVNLF